MTWWGGGTGDGKDGSTRDQSKTKTALRMWGITNIIFPSRWGRAFVFRWYASARACALTRGGRSKVWLFLLELHSLLRVLARSVFSQSRSPEAAEPVAGTDHRTPTMAMEAAFASPSALQPLVQL